MPRMSEVTIIEVINLSWDVKRYVVDHVTSEDGWQMTLISRPAEKFLREIRNEDGTTFLDMDISGWC